MKVKNNTGCIGKGCILLILLCTYLVTPMQVRLLLLKRGKTIQEIKNDFHQYSLYELAVEEKPLPDVKDFEQIYGKIKVIEKDQRIQLILRISKETTSFCKDQSRVTSFSIKTRRWLAIIMSWKTNMGSVEEAIRGNPG